MEVKNVAILGAGNGGATAACEFTERGFNVWLYELPDFAGDLEGIRKNGGFRLVEPNEVPPKDVFVPFTQVTTDIEQAVKDAQVIMLVVPGYAVDRFAEVLAPVVREDQIIFFNGAAAMGCVRFTRKARAMGIDTRFKVCEANSLSYGTRMFPDEARVELSLRVKKLFLAAYPKENTEECLAACVQLYPGLVAGRDIWETTLENGNPEVHPGPCLLSAGHIEYSGGEFWLYREGITEHTVNVLHAIERERMAIGRAFGFELEDAVESRYRRGYFDNDKEDLQHLFNTSEVFTKIKGPTSITSRYFTEDISDGLVLWSDLGRVCGVPTPNIDAVITLGGSLLQVDFRKIGLTLDKLGYGDAKTVDDLLQDV